MSDLCYCEVCNEPVDIDLLERLSGEHVDICPDCMKFSRECEDCGKGYLTLEGLSEDCGEEDVQIRQDKQGRWLCDECKPAVKAAREAEGAYQRRKQRQEEAI
jgi:hypothetical protein